MPNFNWKDFVTEVKEKQKKHYIVSRPVSPPKRTGGDFWRHAFGLKAQKPAMVSGVTPEKHEVKGQGFVIKKDTTLDKPTTPTTRHQFRPA